MKYTVITIDVFGESQKIKTTKSLIKAKKAAIETAEQIKDKSIYIEWYRKEDSQHGFYNPNGEHAVIGQAWD